MARSLLVPVLVSADSLALNLTTQSGTAVTTGVNNGCQIPNVPGQILLFVNAAGATALAATVLIGSTILGQAVTSFTIAAMGTTALSLIGPFHSVLQQPGSNLIFVDFSFSAGTVNVAALSIAGVS